MSILELFFSFKGRIGRRDFWIAYIVLSLVHIAIIVYVSVTRIVSTPYIFLFANFLFFLPSLALYVKRLHDRGRSGWWTFVGWIPYLGVCLLLFEVMMPGGKFKNQYGIRRDVSLFPARSRAAKTLKSVLKGLKKTGDESEFENDLVRLAELNDVLKLIGMFGAENAIADNGTNERIVRFLTERLEFSEGLADKALRILKETRISEFTAEHLARRVFDRFEYDPPFLNELADLLIEIAKADGGLNKHEMALLDIVFDNLDISSEYLDRIEPLSTIYM